MDIVRIVGGIIENDESEYLLVMERTGEIKFLTETLEAGEDPALGLKRGCLQEVDFEVEGVLELSRYSGPGRRGDNLEIIDYYAKRKSGVFVPKDEIIDIKWVDMDYLLDMQRNIDSYLSFSRRITSLINYKINN